VVNPTMVDGIKGVAMNSKKEEGGRTQEKEKKRIEKKEYTER